jgi:hypothetical protein
MAVEAKAPYQSRFAEARKVPHPIGIGEPAALDWTWMPFNRVGAVLCVFPPRRPAIYAPQKL